MLRPLFALVPLTLLLGCAGHDRSPGTQPLSPYGTVSVKAGAGFNGATEDLYLLGSTPGLSETALSFDCSDVTSASGAAERTLSLTLAGYEDRKGKTYAFGRGTSALLFHDHGDGTVDHIWQATGGTLVYRGVRDGWPQYDLKDVTIGPVPDTGAEGTATLGGNVQTGILGTTG